MNKQIGHLALYLDAPLQSWGYQSKFDRRTTLSYPTRSGIIGMLCAALGYKRDDTVSLDSLVSFKMHVHVFQQQSRLTDFHTVGGGWDKKIFPGNIVRKADGTPGTTVVTHREYLESARFGVVLSGEREHLNGIADALRNPRWGIWLGRKACVPASMVFQGIFDTNDEAVQHLSCVAAKEGRQQQKDITKRVVLEVDTFEEGTDTLMDQPLNYAERHFAPRRVVVDIPEEG